MDWNGETLASARAGDRRALAVLVETWQGPVARFVAARTGAGDEVEDLCQTVFVKALLGLPRLRSPEAFEPWLFQLAHNVCRDHLRRRRRGRRLFARLDEGLAAVAAESGPNLSGPDAEVALAAIARLPDGQRRLLDLVAEKPSRSYDELARLCRISVSALKSRLFRARERLRKSMPREGGPR